MDFWLTWIDEDIEQTLEVARLAEAAGYRGIALADHVAVPVSFESAHPSGGPTPFDHRTDRVQLTCKSLTEYHFHALDST